MDIRSGLFLEWPLMKRRKTRPTALVAEVASISEGRNLRLTPIRRRILDLMARLDRAVGAYELLAELRRDDPAFKVVTVYRALDFLRAQGFVHRIESLNAFVVCWHPEERHQAQLLVCESCGDVREVDVPDVAALLGKKARAAGFTRIHQTIEAHGLCRLCGAG
jgi:Fur family zinc uptake transcriptional regulator